MAEAPVIEATSRQASGKGAARAARREGYVPAVVYEIPADVVARLRRDLHAFRARYLLFEDLRHVDRDRVEGHENPAVALAGQVDDGVAVGLFETVYGAFVYSDAGVREYGDLLDRLERRPDDLASAVATLG